MKTEVWGKHAWEFLHACSIEYPDDPSPEDQIAAKALYRSLVRMLPCNDCCQHYAEEMKNDPVENALGSKTQLVAWVLRLHNRVNQRLGKPPLTREQLMDKYKDASCSVGDVGSSASDKGDDGHVPAVLIGSAAVVGIGLVSYLLYRKFSN